MKPSLTELFAERIWGVPWLALMAVALAIAAIYLIIDTTGTSTGLRWLVLRWFHSLCWLLLALAALAMSRVTPLPQTWANGFGVAGGLTYAAFIAVSFWGQASP